MSKENHCYFQCLYCHKRRRMQSLQDWNKNRKQEDVSKQNQLPLYKQKQFYQNSQNQEINNLSLRRLWLFLNSLPSR